MEQNKIKFRIPITPVGQMRARHKVSRKGTQKARSTVYKAKKQREREEVLLSFIKHYIPEKPLTGPVDLIITAYMPIPKSFSRLKRIFALSGELRPAKKPDASNIAKHLEDCLNKRIWRDDAQVVGLFIRKYYSDFPRWEVEICPLKEPGQD